MAGVNTAAMETLLEALLKQTQQQGAAQSRAFDRIARAAGLDPKVLDSTQAKLKKLGDEAEKTAEKSSAMNRAGEVAGSMLADLATGVMATTGNLIQFGSKALQGSAKMSDFFTALKDVPLVGGLAGFFAALAKLQEEELETYRVMSTAGVNFGEGLNNIRNNALAVGLTLQEYGRYMKENSEAMILFGPSTSQGAKNLRDVNKALITGKLGDGLLNLGFSTQELNNLTVSYAKVVGGITKSQQQDYTSLAAASIRYGEEIDFLARITGKSRENLQKQLEEEVQEANWQAFLATKDVDTREKLKQSVNESFALMGKGGAQVAKAQAMGIAVQGEAGRIQTALFGEMTELIRNRTSQALDGSISINKFSNDSIRFMAGAQIKAAEGYERVIKPMGALALQNDALADTVSPMARIFGDLRNNGVLTIEANIERLKQIKAEQDADKKSTEGRLASALAAEAALRKFSALLAETITPLLEHVLKPIIDEISPRLPELGRQLKEAINYFIPSIFTPEGRSKIIKDLGEVLADVVKSAGQVMTERMLGPNVEYKPGGAPPDPKKYRPDGQPNMSYGDLLQTIKNWWNNTPGAGKFEGRSGGSWGATGKLIEDFGDGKNITVHKREGVTTENQMQQIMSGSAAMGAQQAMEQISKGQAEIAGLLRLVAENTRNTASATKDLNPNMFG